MRISSPPIQWPCYYGIDTPTRKELIGSSHNVEEIRRYLGADSLGYLSLDGMLKATGTDPNHFCHACFTGAVPASASSRRAHAAAQAVRRPSDAIREAAHLPRRRRGHRRRGRGGPPHRPLARDTRGRGARRHRRLRGLLRHAPPATASRCWSRRPTGWAPSSRSRSWPAGTTRWGSTSSPWASTTSSSTAPSRSSSSTTSPPAGSIPRAIEAIVAGIAAGCRQAGCALVGGETAEHAGSHRASTTWRASRWAWWSASADRHRPRRPPGDAVLGRRLRAALQRLQLARKVLRRPGPGVGDPLPGPGGASPTSSSSPRGST